MAEKEQLKEVRSTSVAITLNAKQLGVDAFIKLEQTNEFTELVSEVDALVKREEMATLLTEQAIAIAKDTARTVKEYISQNQSSGVTVQVTPTRAGTVAPAGNGADAIRAVANGATPSANANGLDWRVAVDSFDSNKQVRYVSTISLTSDVLKANAASWLKTQNLNPDAFDVWDERRDAENGKPISSVCNIKIKEAFRDKAPAEIVYTDRGGVKAVARAKFNADGSLYFYWANKQVDAAVKYGALNALSLVAQEAGF
jgi:hypothetical protein